ncbi:MarR family transcriptional regulator [Clostridium sp. D2Q-11]|uniref:MarR family transcriptional regulator n=1 Tax=Anaeromonas frigoriresistens TaxID=2683708 RepID=A0A942UVS9_9FIRM|nr:MarR family transcriptional regulator [Anaeromonas frigoriresistens]MBS4539503.1 MarR family transcriptional regulator [Anaeromonas frigoriresistens]
MENLSYILIKVSRHLKNSLDKELKEYKVTASQFSVLNQIAFKNGKITSAEISSRLSSDRPTISGIINRLEENGFLEKLDNPKDKRSAYLKLTNETIDLVKDLRATSDKLNNEIFGDFKENEIKDIKKYLLRIVEKVEE